MSATNSQSLTSPLFLYLFLNSFLIFSLLVILIVSHTSLIPTNPNPHTHRYYVAPLSFMGILLGFAVFEAGQFHENDGLDRLGIIGEELHTEVPPDNALDTGMGDTGDSGISHHGGSDSDMPSHGSLLLILGVSSLTAFACNVCR